MKINGSLKKYLFYSIVLGVLYFITPFFTMFLYAYICKCHVKIAHGSAMVNGVEYALTFSPITPYLIFLISFIFLLLFLVVEKINIRAVIQKAYRNIKANKMLLILSVAIMLILNILVHLFFSNYFIPENKNVYLEYSVIEKLLLLIGVGIGKPIIEEIMLRKYLLDGITSTTKSVILAILIQAILFGLIHFNFPLPVRVFYILIGIFFGLLKVKTKSIYVPAAVHIINNSFIALI